MPIITYTLTCPGCGMEAIVRRTSVHPPPIYCGNACYRQALRERNHASPWRKYHFDDLMNHAILRASRGKRGSLKALWRENPRFERAGIPYPIVKRQAVLLGAVKTEPNGVWSAEEKAFALARWDAGSPADAISRAMRGHGWRRTPGGIVAAMEKWAGPRNGGFLSMHQVALGLGIDSHTVARWVRQGLVRVHHTSDQGQTQYLSYPELRRFILAHPYQVAKGAPDIVWLMSILSPPGAGDTRDAATKTANGAWMMGEAIRDRAATD